MKKVIIGSDHGGFETKELIKDHLITKGFEVKDVGTHSTDSVDYPDVAIPLAKEVATSAFDFGVLVCGTGNGVCMAANKVKGIRAGLAWEPEIGKLIKQHNNANIICVPGRFAKPEIAMATVDAYINSEFEGGRHERRIQKLN